MNAAEAGKLLAILSAVDRREIDSTTAQGWAWALSEVPYERAVVAARAAYDTGAYVDVNAIKGQLRRMRPRLEADVRSAKARRLVPDSWPRDRPLTAEVEARLRQQQAAEWERTNNAPDELAAAGRPVDLGVTLKSAEGVA